MGKAMSEPWFPNPNLFGALFGAIVGGVGGSLLGMLGALSGRLAPQGKGRRWILGAWNGALILGVALLITGVVAWLGGQPYAIWYPILLSGLLFTVVVSSVRPVLVRRYREAEARRIEAEAIRMS
jgi:hypothetical protein